MALKQVDTLQSGEQNAALLYKSGLANYLEVISAQNNTLQASLNLAAIHGHQLMAAVEIYRSLGGGRQLQEK
jgi:outer membrane protein TolC